MRPGLASPGRTDMLRTSCASHQLRNSHQLRRSVEQNSARLAGTWTWTGSQTPREPRNRQGGRLQARAALALLMGGGLGGRLRAETGVQVDLAVSALAAAGGHSATVEIPSARKHPGRPPSAEQPQGPGGHQHHLREPRTEGELGSASLSTARPSQGCAAVPGQRRSGTRWQHPGIRGAGEPRFRLADAPTGMAVPKPPGTGTWGTGDGVAFVLENGENINQPASLHAFDDRTGELRTTAATPWARGCISVAWPPRKAASTQSTTTRLCIASASWP